MSAGTRSSAITATAPASSAMRACSALVTSMMTPPFSISARPVFKVNVPVFFCSMLRASPIFGEMNPYNLLKLTPQSRIYGWQCTVSISILTP